MNCLKLEEKWSRRYFSLFYEALQGGLVVDWT